VRHENGDRSPSWGEDWLSTNEPTRFSREFKLEALRRMEAGENVSVLARELGVSRKSIYQ